jgi:hypothetical protein
MPGPGVEGILAALRAAEPHRPGCC